MSARRDDRYWERVQREADRGYREHPLDPDSVPAELASLLPGLIQPAAAPERERDAA